MKKIIPLTLVVLLLGITACQPEQTKKQYFEESPEIEIAKKAVKAFQDGDAETYRTCYADTARIWQNQYWGKYPGNTVDEQIELLKSIKARQEYFNFDGEIWEMIIQNEGANWVHLWADMHTKYVGDSVEIELPIHVAFSVIDNKIVYESVIFNSLPFFLAEQRLKEKSTK